MAPIPTIQRPGGASGGHPPGAKGRGGGGGPGGRGGAGASASEEKKSELVCRVKYNNTLPDIPFDPKFIAYPFEPNRFIHYAPTSLERNYKYELLTEHDLGVHVDLILPEAYEKPEDEVDDLGERLPPRLDPKDEKLLEDDFDAKTDVKRSKQHAKMLSWMRKPDYISTEQTRYQPTTIEKIESKVGFAVRKKIGSAAADQQLFMDREAQVAAIEKTFDDAKLDVGEHYSKKGVHPVEVFDVLPDDQMWKFPCAQVIFDSDPAPQTGEAAQANAQAQQNEMMSQAMIRGVMDESGEQFVAYFLPTRETMEKRGEDFAAGVPYDEDGEYEYKMFREYNWNVKSKASKGYEENFFFVVRDEGIFYNELETRVRLSKRRLRQGQAPSNSKLVVRHRPPTKQEHKMQRYREKYLEPHGEEEEMSEDEEEEEEEQIKDTHGDEDEEEGAGRRSRSRSGSRSASRSRSRSRSASRSRSRSRSRSGSPRSAASRSRSRSRSRSPTRSRSGSPAGSARSRSRSKSRSRSPRSASRSRSRSRSVGSGSRSPSRSPSRSRSRSGSARSESRSRSSSPGSGGRSGSDSN